jgi:hypothetical protein
MMAQDSILGKWIRAKFGSNVKFAAKIGAHPTLVSRWLGGAGVSEEYEKAIRKLGFEGLLPYQEAEAAPDGPYVTAEELAEWRGYWRAGMERVLERLDALEDRVRKLDQRGAS